MALLEMRDAAAPPVQAEPIPKHTSPLFLILTDIQEKLGRKSPTAVLEYVKGDDESAKRESKILSKMPRGLAPNEVLIVTFTSDTVAGTTNAFVYTVPQNPDPDKVEMVGAMNLEKY